MGRGDGDRQEDVMTSVDTETVKAAVRETYPKDAPPANLSLTLIEKFGVNVERFGDSAGELDLLSGV